MARKTSYSEALPADFVPKQAVAEPIINSAFEEPKFHWFYRGSVPEKLVGRRRAQYWFQTRRTGVRETGELFAEEESDDLPLVNALRNDVRRWRESGHRGATQTTKNLLKHWLDPNRSRRLFYCHQEA